MKGKMRKLFPGANTSNGFYSYFDYIIPKDVNRIFCLKGGPGVGKSSLMKKVAKEFVERGYDVEVFPCSSDPASLDAVVIKKLKVVYSEEQPQELKKKIMNGRKVTPGSTSFVPSVGGLTIASVVVNDLLSK